LWGAVITHAGGGGAPPAGPAQGCMHRKAAGGSAAVPRAGLNTEGHSGQLNTFRAPRAVEYL